MVIWGLVVRLLELAILLTVAGIVVDLAASAVASRGEAESGTDDGGEVVERNDTWRR